MSNNNDLTHEQMQDVTDKKAVELSTTMKVKVLPLLFNHKDEWIVGYVKQPSRMLVRQAIDRLEKLGKADAGDLILETCLIKEESDSRIVDMSPEFDGINLGACIECLSLIEVNMSVTKKNMSNIK